MAEEADKKKLEKLKEISAEEFKKLQSLHDSVNLLNKETDALIEQEKIRKRLFDRSQQEKRIESEKFKKSKLDSNLEKILKKYKQNYYNKHKQKILSDTSKYYQNNKSYLS